MVETLFALGRREGADPLICDANAWTVLHAAVHVDDAAFLETLVKFISPARVKLMLKSLSRTGRSPLHVSAYHSKPEVIKCLLELGADRGQRDKYGNTAGKLAERAGRRVSKELIDGGDSSSFNKRLLRGLAIASMERPGVLAALPSSGQNC